MFVFVFYIFLFCHRVSDAFDFCWYLWCLVKGVFICRLNLSLKLVVPSLSMFLMLRRPSCLVCLIYGCSSLFFGMFWRLKLKIFQIQFTVFLAIFSALLVNFPVQINDLYENFSNLICCVGILFEKAFGSYVYVPIRYRILFITLWKLY